MRLNYYCLNHLRDYFDKKALLVSIYQWPQEKRFRLSTVAQLNFKSEEE